MPNRIIKESIRTSRTVNAMSDFQFRLWVYLITYVDDYGRGSADPELLKGFVFTRRKGVTESTIAKTLAELATMGCINLYEVDGESYLCFPNWGEHQRIQNKKSKYPAPDDGSSQEFTVGHGESPPESNPNPNPNPNPKDSSGEAAPPGANATEFVSIYNEICTNLPRCKVLTDKRKTAIRAFCKQLSAEKWEVVCRIANNSRFCAGENDRGWKADFDFLIKADKATNVLEGRYDGKQTGYDDSYEEGTSF